MIFSRRALAFLIAGSLLLPSVCPAYAKDSATGYVTGFLAFPSGGVMFFTTGTISGTIQSCDDAGLPARWGVDGSASGGGQSMISVLLTAYSLHRPVKIYGSASCPSGLNAEKPAVIVTDGVQ